MTKKVIFLWGLILISLLSCKGKIEQSSDSAKNITKIPLETGTPVKGNTLPVIISTKLSPLSPAKGDRIKAEVITGDMDNDTVTITFLWTKNNEILPETSDNLSTDSSEFKRGDKISLTVTPFDGKQKGNPATLFTYIYNAPPQMKSSIKDARFENKSFIYQVKAEDPDGDILIYSLKTAPAEMTIEPLTGLIQWNVPPEFKGKAPITASVTDGHGGEAVQRFTLDITFQK